MTDFTAANVINGTLTAANVASLSIDQQTQLVENFETIWQPTIDMSTEELRRIGEVMIVLPPMMFLRVLKSLNRCKSDELLIRILYEEFDGVYFSMHVIQAADAKPFQSLNSRTP